jgi:tetratricopeptide (TPR) repeat protein
VYEPTVADCKAVIARIGDHHAAHLDLAGAHYRERDFEAADRHARRAIELDHPTPGLAYNYLACSAFERGDLDAMQEQFMTAAKTDPQHHVLIRNVEAARAWFRERGPERHLPLELVARHDFQLFERTVQPTLPGPLPEDFASWDTTPSPVGEAPRGQEHADLAFLPDPESVMRLDVGNESIEFRSRHLKVLA